MEKDSIIVKKTMTLNLKIEPSLKRALEAIAKSEGVSASARVRMLIRGLVYKTGTRKL